MLCQTNNYLKLEYDQKLVQQGITIIANLCGCTRHGDNHGIPPSQLLTTFNNFRTDFLQTEDQETRAVVNGKIIIQLLQTRTKLFTNHAENLFYVQKLIM